MNIDTANIGKINEGIEKRAHYSEVLGFHTLGNLSHRLSLSGRAVNPLQKQICWGMDILNVVGYASYLLPTHVVLRVIIAVPRALFALSAVPSKTNERAVQFTVTQLARTVAEFMGYGRVLLFADSFFSMGKKIGVEMGIEIGEEKVAIQKQMEDDAARMHHREKDVSPIHQDEDMVVLVE